MKKSWKYGLIAAGTAFAAVSLYFVFNHNSGRMPTLPTPPGVVVPPGLRYVGGDEFEGPDGIAPTNWLITSNDPSTRMKTNESPSENQTPTRMPAAFIRDDSLRFYLNKMTDPNRSTMTQSIASRSTPLTLGESGRMEMRVKMVGESDTLSAQFCFSHKSRNLFLFSFEKKSEEAEQRITGTVFDELMLPHLYKVGAGADAQFHTYAMEWRPGLIEFSRDGVSMGKYDDTMKTGPFTSFIVSAEWRIRIQTWMPDIISERVLRWKTWDMADTPWTVSLLLMDLAAPSDDKPAGLEIDYLRIFQE